jgi:hypothetical protein
LILRARTLLLRAMAPARDDLGKWAGTALLCMVLAACSELRPSLADAGGERGLCAQVPPARQDPAANAYQQAIQRDECIHRWSYAFAAAPDPAEAVVGAVIGACRAQIDRSATMLGEGDAEAERWYLAEMERVGRERALYRVIQARAGNCR